MSYEMLSNSQRAVSVKLEKSRECGCISARVEQGEDRQVGMSGD
jgi:hypothetical protein